MDPNDIVMKQLDEAHALESALVTNLIAHRAMTTDAPYRAVLDRHLEETQEQVKAIDERRTELGRDGGRGVVSLTFGLARDLVGQALVLTKGPLDVVRTTSQTERMLKNAKDECATEALEIATYDGLEAAAEAAGDTRTAQLAVRHREQEERALADLRGHVARLSVQTVGKRTGESAKVAA